jgi:Ca2+-binding RTX toxin-like protein
MLAAASSASGAVAINEVESDAGAGSDFVELFNTGAATVDISGYVLKDSGEGNNFTIPAGTTIAPGGFYATDVSGLGSSDSARLFTPSAAPVDSYSWTSHAAATYGRCPDGTGAFTSTNTATKGTANDCPVAASVWPGGAAISIVDDVNVFGSNLSGLAYQPSGSGSPGILWAVRNGPSTLFRLVWDGTKWTPDTANGWGAGKQLLYPDGTGVPDAEGVTLAGGDPNGVFVSTERNDNGADSNTSRPAVLRYDISSSSAALNATRDWNLTTDLPGLAANAGLEAVAWVPDDVLVSKGFLDETTVAAYNPATYPDHGSGLFFVGVEQDGRIIAYALNQTTGAFTRVASIASGFPKVMDLQYEPETTHLWAVCDDSCNGHHATLDVAQSGPNDGRFVVTGTYERPGGMANLNNEGFAIAPQAECVNGLKPVFWSDDGNTASHALRAGTLNCTVPPAGPAPDRDGDGKPDSGDACPDVAAATANGCPAAPADRDGDGKPDNGDACPDVAAATANGCPAPVGATAGNDTLNGDSGPNVICGLLGNDIINGLKGNDTLFGDACNDKVKVTSARAATDGNDKLRGAEGNDILYGAGGRDSLSGGPGSDKLFGGDGDDSLDGGTGNDKLDGGRGNDKLAGGPGANSYSGGAGNDSVNARNHKKETVNCGSGKKDVATVDKNDKVKGCEKVRRK